MTGFLHDRYGNYDLAFLIGIGVSVVGAVTIWLAAPGKVRAVAGQLHRSHASVVARSGAPQST